MQPRIKFGAQILDPIRFLLHKTLKRIPSYCDFTEVLRAIVEGVLKILQGIRDRRSIRTFDTKDVPKTFLLKIMEAATLAPSAHNVQPWRFTVITDWKRKHTIAVAMAEKWNEDLTNDGVSLENRRALLETSKKCFSESPVLIVAAITMKEMDVYPDEKRQEYEHLLATQSLAAAIQNMLLAIHTLGLAACWHCAPLFCQEAVRKVLNMPSHVEPQALISLGYPYDYPEMPPRKALSEVFFRDKWGKPF